MCSDIKKKAILSRINNIENEIDKACKYLQNGAHADWHGFRPLFTEKVKDGKVLPPHKDWVRNVFIPSRERALRKAEKLIDRLESNK